MNVITTGKGWGRGGCFQRKSVPKESDPRLVGEGSFPVKVPRAEVPEEDELSREACWGTAPR